MTFAEMSPRILNILSAFGSVALGGLLGLSLSAIHNRRDRRATQALETATEALETARRTATRLCEQRIEVLEAEVLRCVQMRRKHFGLTLSVRRIEAHLDLKPVDYIEIATRFDKEEPS